MSSTIRFGLLALTVSLLLAPPVPAEEPPKGGSSPAKRPIPTDQFTAGGLTLPNGPSDLLIRGDCSRLGRFDKDGNFVPEPFYESLPPMGPMSGPIQGRFTNHVKGPSAMAEHRSGRLLLGTMVKGVFVPEIGSKVLDLKKDFDIKKPDRIVYNLPETVAAFWTEERKGKFPNGLPNDPEPPAAGVPHGLKLVPFREVTPTQQDPWQIRVIGKIAEFGHLDERGEFIPDYSLPIVSRNGILGVTRTGPTVFLDSSWLYYTLPYDGIRGLTEVDSEEVYEFRSGRLIKGTLQKTGNFVPEIGSTIIDFKDYEPNQRRRIYNLPGVLRPVKK